MQDASSVIAEAAEPIVKKLAEEYEVGLRRMYEILGPDNPYPKAKKLIRKIGRLNKEGVRLIKADMDALFAAILDEAPEPTLEQLHKEAYEAIQSILTGKPRAIKEKELRDLIAVSERFLCAMDQQALPEGFER